MRTLVLYTSYTGNTKKYAEKIAMGISTEAVPFKKSKWKRMDLSAYDTIVYGGWICGSQIQGLDDFLSRYEEMKDKNVIVFCDGMGFVSKESRDNLISANILDLYHIRFYQLRGSFDYSKLRFPKNLMIRLGIKGAVDRNDGNTDVEFLKSILNTPFEYNDQDGVDRILSVLHRLSTENKA